MASNRVVKSRLVNMLEAGVDTVMEQLELLNSDAERELSHIFSSMTLDACGRD